MQNMMNMSLFYVANPLQCYAYIPFNPSYFQLSTSPLQHRNNPNEMSHSAFKLQGALDVKEETSSINSAELSLQQHSLKQYMNHQNGVDTKISLYRKKLLTSVPIIQKINDQEFELGTKDGQIQVCELKNLQQRQKKEKTKKMKSQTDQIYSPQKQRKAKAVPKYQANENRNVVPNYINQIFSFVQKQNKSGQLVVKLFQKYPHVKDFTPKRFYLYQALIKSKLGHYTTENNLKLVAELYQPKCEYWSEEEQRYYNKICRVLIHHYLYEESIFSILTSKRMKKDKKFDHLRVRRNIAQTVGNILKGL